jgi:hypothetical protein
MVCCQKYWAAHSVDAAGRTGVSLQKILFFLSVSVVQNRFDSTPIRKQKLASDFRRREKKKKKQKIIFFSFFHVFPHNQAMTAVTVLTMDPFTIMGAGVALLVYGVGIHGAQKRKHQALFFYGAVSLASLVMSLVAVAFVGGFLLFGGAHLRPHATAPSSSMLQHMGQHAHQSLMRKMHDAGVVAPKLSTTKGTAQDGTQFELVDIAAPGTKKPSSLQLVELMFPNKAKQDSLDLQPLAFPNQQPMQSESDDDATAVSESESSSESSESDSDNDRDIYDEQVEVHVTPFGWTVLTLAVLISFLMLVLKVKSIRLAFQMRRMLLAMQASSLPTVRPPTGPAPVQLASVPTNVRPPTGPAPSTRRDCSRCTYVNAAGAVRCAMCDSALPIVAAPTAVPAAPVPRVYVPGALYPLNQPLN